MATDSKSLSNLDANQVLKAAHNENNSTLGVDGYIAGKPGRRIVRADTASLPVGLYGDDFSYYDIVEYRLGSLVSASSVATISSTTDIEIGQYISNPNLPVNTYVVSVDSPIQITLSANSNTTVSSVSLGIANLLMKVRVLYSDSDKTVLSSVERVE